MKFFNRKKKLTEAGAAATPQIVRGDPPPFGLWRGYTPLRTGDKQLYRAIREAVPLVDACICKIIRLCGGVSAECEDPRADRELKRFLEQVDVGRGQRGINAFLDQYLDSMLMFGQAVGELQYEYEDISFLLLDSVPRDSSGQPTDLSDNVHCISYREEESGYLAGYMAVLEGYRRFGFIGGEEIPSVERYGYGFLRGIDDAAVSQKVSRSVSVKYWYADTFSTDKRIEEVAGQWYEDGVEIIFACGGLLYESVLSAAREREV